MSLLFAGPVVDPSCGAAGQWPAEVRHAVNLWKHAGVHSSLVLTCRRPAPSSRTSPHFDPVFARRDLSQVGLLDARASSQDDNGIAQMQMPCLPRGEPGCANHRVSVRDPVDHAHFCASRDWQGLTECPASVQGGDRRVAAAIVASFASALRDNPPKLRPVAP